ncbi:PREDICTED: plant UBX domain-containing protein 11 [Nelumbo nucifera]|uniref:Plant UBX domain-containing protein 11 n=1 Tax=Nelumbo nucifera TaxID=4432 RepID=A0A1U8AKP4_NELNU|nr:PREDICTED: plant UBX domain-containing protein 11 [Nelumbo nucifera]
MERSISVLTFKGSISEAIIEAKRQKKLFVVYTSGEDDDSKLLEQTTWMDLNVGESISKFCIFLHILQGSPDALHFSAIYPQKSFPCITVVGYNGLQLWQHEGYISAEALASRIEKAWLSLQMQEATATVLTAALASKKAESLSFSSLNASSSDQGTSSSINDHFPSIDQTLHDTETKILVAPDLLPKTGDNEPQLEMAGEVSVEHPTHASMLEKGKDKLPDPLKSGDRDPQLKIENEGSTEQLMHANKLENGKDELSAPLHETTPELHCPVTHLSNVEVDTSSFSSVDEYSAPHVVVDDHGSGFSQENSTMIIKEAGRSVQDGNNGDLGNSGVGKPRDVNLNIKLPDGGSLQEKFSVTDTLQLVKDFVNENHTGGIGSYDLAVPYPRKVFTEHDLIKSLSELGLFNRQALILVPHNKATGSNDRNYSSDTDHSSESSGGYYGFVKRVLSFLNPFSYLGSTASGLNSQQESNAGLWQYRPNPTYQSHLPERQYNLYSPNRGTNSTEGNSSKSKRSTASRIGSNIHTLKRDEDVNPFKDRNAFWNGNSTQYGNNGDN